MLDVVCFTTRKIVIRVTSDVGIQTRLNVSGFMIFSVKEFDQCRVVPQERPGQDLTFDNPKQRKIMARIELTSAEYQTLQEGEYSPKSIPGNYIGDTARSCVEQGLAREVRNPQYPNDIKYEATELGKRALKDARRR